MKRTENQIPEEKTRSREGWEEEGQAGRERRGEMGIRKALECRVQLQNGISLGSVSSTLIGLTSLIPPDVQH